MRLTRVPPSLLHQSASRRRLQSAKRALLQGRRLAEWLARPQDFPVAPLAESGERLRVHEIRVNLRSVQSHPSLEEGKRRNVALAAAAFDGRLISPETPFSFWRILGPATRAKGFAAGTELRDGCVIPSIGGGLCLVSGALFRLAAELDFSILERHGHTAAGRDDRAIDATVFWPQVDLRFAPRRGEVVLQLRVVGDELIVRAYSEELFERVELWREDRGSCRSEGSFVRSSELYRRSPRVARELLGRDRKREMDAGLRRNCLTCNETRCASRKRFLEVM